jgi:hypothetical protein
MNMNFFEDNIAWQEAKKIALEELGTATDSECLMHIICYYIDSADD